MAELIKTTDSLNDGRKKLNDAITDSNAALSTANTAKQTANLAKAESESTQTQLDTIVIEGDSSVEAAQARVNNSGTAFPTLKQRLDAEHQEVTAQLQQTEQNLNAQLAQKAVKGDIGISDLDKNKTQFDETWLTDELVSQLTDGSPLHSRPANFSVGLEKLKFTYYATKNRFNKETVSLGNLQADGSIGGTNFYTSDYIPVSVGDNVFTSPRIQSYIVYDNNLDIVETKLGFAVDNFEILTSGYIRVSFLVTYVDNFMVTINESVEGEYEPFKMFMSSYFLDDIDASKIAGSLDITKIKQLKQTNNLFNKKTATKGYYVNPQNGSIVANSTFFYSDYMAVKPNITYSFNNFRFLAFFDKDKKSIGGLNSGDVGSIDSYKMPSNAHYVIASMVIGALGDFQFEEGMTQTPYVEYGYTFDDLYLNNSQIVGDEKTIVTLPKKIYGVVGKENRLYFNNIIDKKREPITFDIVGTEGQQMEDYWVDTPTTSYSKSMNVDVYDDFNMVSQNEVDIKVSYVNRKDTSVLVLGDSLVNSGQITSRLLDLYGEESSALTLLGTRGSEQNKYEGRGGWTGATYRTGAEIYGSVNPFYNPAKTDFDFSYFMSKQGYSTPDHVILVLGINETFSFTTDSTIESGSLINLQNLDFIIDSIHEYDSNIKVGVSITIPPNNSQDAFGLAYKNGQTQWRYKRNNAIWTKKLIEHYQDKETESIYLVPMQHNIDTVKNIADGVHPNTDGYNQIGDSVYYYLKSFT